MSGEGRGHASRAHALMERLRHWHELKLFAPAQAYEMLEPICAQRRVPIERIPGITNVYDRAWRFDLAGTGRSTLRYLHGLPRLVRRLEEMMRVERPDLVITDFEPAVPRAAERAGVPYVSVNHQHFLIANDLRSLPPYLRMHAFAMGLAVRCLYRRQIATIISSFYAPPLKERYRHVLQVGALLRPEVLRPRPTLGDDVLVYMRRFAPPVLLEGLEASGRRVRVFGLGARPPRGAIEFCAVDGDRFVEELARSYALITTAGNQIVGEALALGKSVLALPEARNYEQAINAHFLAESGCGTWAPIDECGPAVIERFLREVPTYRKARSSHAVDGTPRVIAALERLMSEGRVHRSPDTLGVTA